MIIIKIENGEDKGGLVMCGGEEGQVCAQRPSFKSKKLVVYAQGFTRNGNFTESFHNRVKHTCRSAREGDSCPQSAEPEVYQPVNGQTGGKIYELRCVNVYDHDGSNNSRYYSSTLAWEAVRTTWIEGDGSVCVCELLAMLHLYLYIFIKRVFYGESPS